MTQYENSTTSSGKLDVTFNPRIPVVHHLTSGGLLSIGFVLFDKVYLEKGQGWKMVYQRGCDIISYNGAQWLFNGKQVQFFEDLV